MLFSIATYFGLDAFSGPTFKKLVSYISLVLAIPVVTYSALDYWRVAWTTLKQKRLAIEVPIAAGILAIFSQSALEVLSGRGEGCGACECGAPPIPGGGIGGSEPPTRLEVCAPVTD